MTFYDVPFLVWGTIYISVMNVRREVTEAGSGFETLYCLVYNLAHKSLFMFEILELHAEFSIRNK